MGGGVGCPVCFSVHIMLAVSSCSWKNSIKEQESFAESKQESGFWKGAYVNETRLPLHQRSLVEAVYSTTGLPPGIAALRPGFNLLLHKPPESLLTSSALHGGKMAVGRASEWKVQAVASRFQTGSRQEQVTTKDHSPPPSRKPSWKPLITQPLVSHWSELCLTTVSSKRVRNTVVIAHGHMCFTKMGVCSQEKRMM